MLFLRKLFKLPSPKDLGWSEYNALESEEWSENPQGKTWEQYYKVVKEMHPVRYWFAETLGDFLRYKVWFKIANPIGKAHYWLVSHFIPSRRYHMLDLRQPNGYRYGWQDVPEKMLYAMFNLLGEYLKEEPCDLTTAYSKEEIEASVAFKSQQDSLEEARALHHWWTVERQQEFDRRDDLQNKWYEARVSKGSKKEEYWDQLKKMNLDLEAKEDDMLMRLIKLRKSLWT